MKSKKYVYIGIAVAAGIAAAIIIIPQFNVPQSAQNKSPLDPYLLALSYEGVNSDLKSTLFNQQINMSNPIKLGTRADINRYCNFLSNQTKQAMIEYCTSTELKDFHGNYLGSINMVGSNTAPVLVITAVQTNPTFSNFNLIKTVFGDVVNETICQCWDKTKPGGYSTLSAMMDAQRDFHLKGTQQNSTTNGVPLGGVHFEIELSTNNIGYVWKLLVAK